MTKEAVRTRLELTRSLIWLLGVDEQIEDIALAKDNDTMVDDLVFIGMSCDIYISMLKKVREQADAWVRELEKEGE